MKILLLDSGRGVIPFIKEILKMDKRNTYYIYMDHEFFPYGEKTEKELKEHLEHLLKKFENYKINQLCICCNTLSGIYLKYRYKTSYVVKTILEINLKHTVHKKILVTPLLQKLYPYDDRFVSTPLASAIENMDIKQIILDIKNLPHQKYVLGCTHYPLVKELFHHYLKNDVFSYESEFVSKIRQGETLLFYGGEYEQKILKNYFYDLVIYPMNYT